MLTKGEMQASQRAARRRINAEVTTTLRDDDTLNAAITRLLNREQKETRKIVERHIKSGLQTDT